MRLRWGIGRGVGWCDMVRPPRLVSYACLYTTRADLQERSRHMQAAQHSTRLHCRLLPQSPIEPNTGGRVRLSKSDTTGRHFVADMESWQKCRSRCHRDESAQQFQYRRSDHPGSNHRGGS